MSLAWFDCSSGASGDMLLGALVDAGADLTQMQRAVDALQTEPIGLSAHSVTRRGLGATKVDVQAAQSNVLRTWGNIRSILEQAELAEPVRQRALDVFSRLARAEAHAHRISAEQVHFHEVGALDAIADVVGACAGLHQLGITRVVATPVALGSGVVRSDHGLLPVPGPAVLALLEEVAAPVYSGDIAYEMCTPTGAALLAATVAEWGGLPAMTIASTGSGAGGRDLEEQPNILRVVVGEATQSAGVDLELAAAVVVEANVDDLDPRIWPAVLERLLAAGAADAWLTPITMKKGRPAHTLSVLTAPQHLPDVRRVVFTESSTIGVRQYPVDKYFLRRELRTVLVDGHEIHVKVAFLDGRVVNAAPEFDDAVAAAASLNRPVKAVLAAASAAAHDSGHLPT